MISHITITKGRLARNPHGGLAEEGIYTCMCLVCDAGGHVVSLWLYAFGELAKVIEENLSKGDEIGVKAETASNDGKYRIPCVGIAELLVITEMEVDGKVIAV